MLDQADALIEGFRPGVMERLGLGPDVLLAADGAARAMYVLVADSTGLSVGDDVDVGFVITPEFTAEHNMTGVWKAFLGKWQLGHRFNDVFVLAKPAPRSARDDVKICFRGTQLVG